MRINESMRSIRGIERSSAFTKIEPTSRYGAYPYREGEPQLPPQSSNDDWNRELRRAAGSAAEWQQLAKQALAVVNRLIASVERERRQASTNPVGRDKELEQLTAHMNALRTSYASNAEYLRPETWFPIEKALRQFNEFSPQQLQDTRLLRDLRSALASTSEQPVSELISLSPHPTMPYAAYYSSA